MWGQTREVAAFFDHMGGENKRTDGPPVIWTMGSSGPDPDYLANAWKLPGFTNMGISAELDKLLDEQRTLKGPERDAKLQEVSKYLLTNAYAIPLVSPGWNFVMAAPANVTGFRYSHVSGLKFNDVKLP